jgi:hypothetical protein
MPEPGYFLDPPTWASALEQRFWSRRSMVHIATEWKQDMSVPRLTCSV